MRRSIAFLLLTAGCFSPPVEAPRTRVDEETRVSSPLNPKDKVDLLFLVDDSGSMKPKQEELRRRFPDLIKVLNELGRDKPASYHIGVVTSDLGAPGLGCGKNRGGKLQALGADAPAGCKGPVGKSYIEYDQRDGTDNFASTGQDLATTFGCMAAVGTDGCGFEMQLEAVYRALHDPLPENQGFLRDDAILAVVFLTDEDDCSAPPTSDLFSNAAFGPLNSYRCARYGVACDGAFPLPEAPQSSFQGCVPATSAQGGKLVDLSKYIHFFKQPRSKGGVKDDPADVLLASIAAPATPLYTERVSEAMRCGAGVTSCTLVGHSCVLASDPAFFGDPALRVESVVRSVVHHQLGSICDEDYKAALEGIGRLIVKNLGVTCVRAPLPDPANPDCVVEYVTGIGADAVRTSIPRCDAAAPRLPCWHLDEVSADDCTSVCNPLDRRYQRYAVRIDRAEGPAGELPPATSAAVSCATLAIANEDPDAACRPNAL